MPSKILLRPASTYSRQQPQPLLKAQSSRVAEVVGGTAAECAAVCCCCPCAIANLLILAIYKVPAGLCRKALRKHRKGALPPRRRRCACGCDDTENQIHVSCIVDVSDVLKSEEVDKELQQLENEMWEKFFATGFWRSSSQSQPTDAVISRIPNSSNWEIVNATTCHGNRILNSSHQNDET